MKKLILLAALSCSTTAFAKGPSFADMDKLYTLEGYTIYGVTPNDPQNTFFFVDGGRQDRQVATIRKASVLNGDVGFAVARARNAAEYARNSVRAKEYAVSCERQIAWQTNLPTAPAVPFARLTGTERVAARIACTIAR